MVHNHVARECAELLQKLESRNDTAAGTADTGLGPSCFDTPDAIVAGIDDVIKREGRFARSGPGP